MRREHPSRRVNVAEPRVNRLVFARAFAILLAVGLVGFYVGVPSFRVWQATRGPNLMRRDQPSHATPAGYRDVAFVTSDGLTLRGWYRPSANGAAVVLTHGYSLDRAFLLPQAEILAEDGFGVLTYDLRAHGTSDGTLTTRGWLETEDVLGAVAFVADQPDVDPNRIGAFGFSIGAQATLRAATRSDAIRAVVADGPVAGVFADEPPVPRARDRLNDPAKWIYYALLGLSTGVDPPEPLIEELHKITPRPLLLISAGRGHEQRQEAWLFAAAGPSATLWEIPETGHGGGLTARPAEYASRLIEHFQSGLHR